MKKELATTNKTFNQRFAELNKLYKGIEKNMLKVSELVYSLKNEDPDTFIKRATEEIGMSKSTISKFGTVGEILANQNAFSATLPDSYNKIYALNPVKSDIDGFDEYMKNNGEEKGISSPVKKIEYYAKHYFDDETPEPYETEQTESESESEVSDGDFYESLFYGLLDRIYEIENSTKKVSDKLSNIIDFAHTCDDRTF